MNNSIAAELSSTTTNWNCYEWQKAWLPLEIAAVA